MSNILNKILATKSSEIAEAKKSISIEQLKTKSLELNKPRDFIQALREKHLNAEAAVIAEIKILLI